MTASPVLLCTAAVLAFGGCTLPGVSNAPVAVQQLKRRTALRARRGGLPAVP